jgi:heavy metal translocating P-type ATPase
LSGRPWPGRAAGTYCCYGCLSLGEQQHAALANHNTNSWKFDGLAIRLGISLLVVGQSMMFGLALNLHDDVPAGARWFTQTLILGGTLLVAALLGGPLVRAAWAELRRGRLTIEALFLLTMTGAMAASLQAHLTGRGKIYFEVVSILLVVYSLGKMIGARSRSAAIAGSRAWAGQLSSCRIIDEKNRTRTVPVSEIVPGDLIDVHPGETIAVDGIIRSGTGYVSEAPVSGEPFAVVRRPGDRVLAGTASYDSAFRIEATAAGTERQVDRLLAAVEEARDRPLSLQAQADRIGRVLFPVVVLTALGTFGYWTFLTPAGWEVGLFNAMSVLLVACPCVIGLATPIVIWSVLGRLAERGLIVRSGDAVERLAEVDQALFDKTGTLTEEKFTLVDIVTESDGDERAKLLGWVSLIEERSSHPVARAFAQLPRPFTPGDEPKVLFTRAIPGCGIEAEIEEASGERHHIRIGTTPASGGRKPPVATQLPIAAHDLNDSAAIGNRAASGGRIENDSAAIGSWVATGGLRPPLARIAVAVDGRLAAVATVAERVRDSVPQMLADFRRLEIPVAVLTGDRTGRATAPYLSSIHAGLLPDDKRAHIEKLKQAGARPLMVGDGINDASALASAHAGIALSSGTDLAVGASDVTLYHGDLRVLPWAIEESRAAIRAVRWNLIRATGYNLVGMALAACGVLHPVVAALLMVVSSLSLIFSATRVGISRDFCEETGDKGQESEVRSQESGIRLRWRAVAHGAAFAMQGAVALLLLDSLRSVPAAALVVALFAAGGACLAWFWRRWSRIPHTLDMSFGMLTFGNLGMLLGWWADSGFAPLHDAGCAACAAALRGGLMAPWMWVGMLVLANVAMLALGRRPLPSGRAHVLGMATGGNLGMVLGMAAGGAGAAQVPVDSVSLAAGLAFAAMTAGMLLGMILGTWLAEGIIAAARSAVHFPRWFANRPLSRTGE